MNFGDISMNGQRFFIKITVISFLFLINFSSFAMIIRYKNEEEERKKAQTSLVSYYNKVQLL